MLSKKRKKRTVLIIIALIMEILAIAIFVYWCVMVWKSPDMTIREIVLSHKTESVVSVICFNFLQLIANKCCARIIRMHHK